MEGVKLQPEQIEALMAEWKIGDEELRIMGVSSEKLFEADKALLDRLFSEHCDRNVRGQDKPRIDSFLSLMLMRVTPQPEKKKPKRGKGGNIDLHDIRLQGFADDEVSIGRYTTAARVVKKDWQGVEQISSMSSGVLFSGIKVSEAFAQGMHRDFIVRRRVVHIDEGYDQFREGKTVDSLAAYLEETTGEEAEHIAFVDTHFANHRFEINNPLVVSVNWINAGAHESHQPLFESSRLVGRRKWEARSIEEVQEMLILRRAEILERIKISLKGPKFMEKHVRDHGIKSA